MGIDLSLSCSAYVTWILSGYCRFFWSNERSVKLKIEILLAERLGGAFY